MHATTDGKVHGVNMRPIWVLSAPDGPHVGPWTLLSGARHAAAYENQTNPASRAAPDVILRMRPTSYRIVSVIKWWHVHHEYHHVTVATNNVNFGQCHINVPIWHMENWWSGNKSGYYRYHQTSCLYSLDIWSKSAYFMNTKKCKNRKWHIYLSITWFNWHRLVSSDHIYMQCL